MTSLRKAAELSQKVIKIGGITLVALMVGRLVIGGVVGWYKAKYPNVPKPTMGFGILPEIEFPEQEKKQLTYKLETVTGKLPQMPSQADVLYMQPMRPNLLALENSQDDAEALGFKTNPEKVSDTTYRWRTQTPVPMSLTMAIYDGRFIWKTDWAADPNFLAAKTLPTETQATKEAKDLVKKVDSEADDVVSGEASVSFLKGSGGSFQKAMAFSEADFVQVDLFRKTYNEQYKFVTPETGHGIVRVILSGNPRSARVIQVYYNNFKVDYDRRETYPLKPISQAWQELEQGNGYIASLQPGVTEAVIRRVELAYFDGFEPQQYMQPVYVFSGDGDFSAYIPAVSTL